ncbi:MAG: plastocyanin/azurin family copper-binding protein [Chloroflexi bacterium]|nr:plastocyanin/azurin family copper-binding protein [Chloroflexota bacterium]
MNRSRTLRTAGAGPLLRPALAALLLVLAACGGGGDGATASASPVATTTVDLPKSYRFEPAVIVVDAGATVTWTNNDNFSHTVRFDGQDALAMAPGASVTRMFPTSGQFAYVCTLHPQDMKGTVLVTGP